jgi:hypothetical protein
MRIAAFFITMSLAVSVAACGGGGGKTGARNTAGAQASPAGGANPSMATGAAAPVPASLHCGAVQPVWANTKTHVYHEPSDPMYGRTKHGRYMCPSQATAAGYRAAGGGKYGGRKHRRAGGAMAQPSPSP